MKTIQFVVPDAVAEEMKRNAVYLDVFGIVRWTHDNSAVRGASWWVAA